MTAAAADNHAVIGQGMILDPGSRTSGPKIKKLVIALTVVVMIGTSLPNVPRAWVDFSGLPLLGRLDQFETYGTDTIADMYGSKVVLNDPLDMYTKAKLAQTPLEAATWSKEASAPYPPVMLLTMAGLYAVGETIGVGYYGMILALAVMFLGLSLCYFLATRWYLFPLLYLNFVYVSHRFVYVQDGSYLVMLVVVLGALLLARARHPSSHALMAVATTMKLSPLYYAKNVFAMTRPMAVAFVWILAAAVGLTLHALFPSAIRFGSVGPIVSAILLGGLIYYVRRIGWDTVRDDLRHPVRTARQLGRSES